MRRKIILVVMAIMELLFLQQWLSCMRFAGQFHFSPFDLSLRLIEAIHNDGEVPIFIVRVFHNKILGTALDVYNSYAHYWSIVFLVQLLSFVGVFGLLCCVWYLFQKKCSKWIWTLLVVALAAPIAIIIVAFNFPFILQIGLIVAPLLAMSFLGWWRFLADGHEFRYIVFVVLEMLSVLWLFSTLLQSNILFCS